MEAKLEICPKFEFSTNSEDSRKICEISTLLVATIQEVKKQLSETEFIFCSQLFPRIQSRSGFLENRLADARKSVEDEWKKKEENLRSKMEELHLEKKHAHEEIQLLNFSLEQSNRRLVDYEKLLCDSEAEKKRLVDQLEHLTNNEDIVVKLREQLRQESIELAKVKEFQESQSQELQRKDKELLTERTNRREVCEHYKCLKGQYNVLKSQYTFLLGKKGLTMDNKPQSDKTEAEQVSPALLQNNKRSFQDQETAHSSSKTKEVCSHEQLEGDQAIGISKTSTSLPPTRIIAVDARSNSSSSLKRAASSWRGTRVRQQLRGADPHDDFLDTPLELARNLNKVVYPGEVQVQDLPVPAPQDLDFNNSDDETQDITIEDNAQPQPQPISIARPVGNSFKYVEPVRKKAERANLKGVECEQCKKFYDVVLPQGGPGGDGSHRDHLRCEHHDGVSRHRYRYAPPMTPEGFWNIGFESEM